MNTFQLVLTGDTTPQGRFVSIVSGQPVALPEIRHVGLLVLICVKLRRSGVADLSDFSAAGVAYSKACLHQLIRRLRCDLDAVLGSGSGNQFVIHRGRSRYSLQIAFEDFTVEPGFRELEHDLPHAVFQLLAARITERSSELLHVSNPLPSTAN